MPPRTAREQRAEVRARKVLVELDSMRSEPDRVEWVVHQLVIFAIEEIIHHHRESMTVIERLQSPIGKAE